MRRTSSIVASIIAAALAAIGISNLTRTVPNDRTGPLNQQVGMTKRSPSHKNGPVVISACEEIKERLQPLLTSHIRTDSAVPSTCYTGNPSSNGPRLVVKQNTAFSVLFVPNPIATHLPLLFDRIIEIVQQAAQDNGYLYTSSWLPWNEETPFSQLRDQLSEERAQYRQDKQPGVLIFRQPEGHPGGLIVFVASELPTRGINEEQFENAILWMDKLGGLTPGQEFKIIGPTFSGSLASLNAALVAQRQQSGKNVRTYFKAPTIHILSGSVTSSSDATWFNDQLTSAKLGKFETSMEYDVLLINRFCEYIGKQGVSTDRVAILSEDETAFGGETLSHSVTSEKPQCFLNGTPINLIYPRDIANLRSAYQQQSLFSSSEQGAEKNTINRSLRGDLSEPENSEHDSVRSYSGQLMPLAQEAVLLNIVDILKDKEIQFVILRSTNSLDQIFLTEFLRRSVPGARVVLDGADLLFRRGSEGASLRGVMVLSSFPLLLWQTDWSPPKSDTEDRLRVFGDDTIEGTYVAARKILPLVSGGENFNFAPSASVVEKDGKPATWISVISAHQFWPVAVLNDLTLANQPLERLNADFTRVPREFWVCLLLCAAWGILHLLWCLCGSISPFPSRFRSAHFAPMPRWQHPTLIAFGTLLLAMLAAAIFWSSGVTVRGWGVTPVAVVVLLFSIFGLAVSGCIANYKLPVTQSDDYLNYKRATKKSGFYALGAFGLFLGLQFWIIHGLSTANLQPAMLRSTHILSGVSPLVPQLLFICGFYLWFLFELRGLALFGDDRPLLPYKTDLNNLTPLFVFSHETTGLPTECHAMPLTRMYFTAFICIAPLVGVVSAITLEYFAVRTLGEEIFGIYIFIWLCVGLSTILSDTAQAWTTWRNLQVLLVHLDRLPLRRTLKALKGLTWQSIWAMSANVLAERYCLVSREIEALRHLTNLMNTYTPKDEAESNCLHILRASIDNCQEKIRAFAAWYQRFYPGTVPNRHREILAAINACREKFELLSEYYEKAKIDLAHGEKPTGMYKVQQLEAWYKALNDQYAELSRNHDERQNHQIARVRIGACQQQLSFLAQWYKESTISSLESDVLEKRIADCQENLKALEGWCDEIKSEPAVAIQTLTLPLTSAGSVQPLQELQRELASIAGLVLTHILIPHWNIETDSLLFERQPHPAPSLNTSTESKSNILPFVLASEEFVVLPYVGFIQNILGRIRTIALGILCLFVATTLAIASYPFDPLPLLGTLFLAVFVIIGVILVSMYAAMHRDPTLSYITDSNPGELGSEFWRQLIAFGVGPVLGLLTTLFPSITDYVTTWLQSGAPGR